MSVTGEPDGRPLKAGTAVVDLVCGLLAANGIQAALVERARTGVGRHVEVSLMDSALTCLLNQGSAWVAAGVKGRRRGNRHPSIVPYETYETADRADRRRRRQRPHVRAAVRGRRAGRVRRALRDQRGARRPRRRARRRRSRRVLREQPADALARACCARRRSRPGRSTASTRRSRYAEELGMEPVADRRRPAADQPAAADRRRAPADPPPPAPLDEHGDDLRAWLRSAGRG